MLEWCLYLTPVCCEAVEELTKVPAQKICAGSTIKDLEVSAATADEPLCKCKLANAAMEAEDYPYLNKELPELYKKWRSTNGKTEIFEKFEELMVKRGWNG